MYYLRMAWRAFPSQSREVARVVADTGWMGFVPNRVPPAQEWLRSCDHSPRMQLQLHARIPFFPDLWLPALRQATPRHATPRNFHTCIHSIPVFISVFIEFLFTHSVAHSLTLTHSSIHSHSNSPTRGFSIASGSGRSLLTMVCARSSGRSPAPGTSSR